MAPIQGRRTLIQTSDLDHLFPEDPRICDTTGTLLLPDRLAAPCTAAQSTQAAAPATETSHRADVNAEPSLKSAVAVHSTFLPPRE